MGLLARLLGPFPGSQDVLLAEETPCVHGVVLMPQWDDIRDMGQEDKATRYRCASCLQEFTPAEAFWFRLRAADRLRDRGTAPSQN